MMSQPIKIQGLLLDLDGRSNINPDRIIPSIADLPDLLSDQ